MRFTLVPHSGLTKQLSSLQANSNSIKRHSALIMPINEIPHQAHQQNNPSCSDSHRTGTHEKLLPLDDQAKKPLKSHNPNTQITISGFPFSDRAQPPHLSHHQSHQSKNLEQVTTSLAHSQSLSNFLRSLENQDFQATLANFNRLTASQKSRLSTHVYDSLFWLAGRILEEDKIINPINDQYQPNTAPQNLLIESGSQNHSYTIDYCQVQARLMKVNDLFHSIQRALSVDQLHFYLQNTILSAALVLRRTYQSSNSQAPDEHSKEIFLEAREQISGIIERIPALHQIPTPTADQLAEAVPFEILGLYSRFLAVFHQPNQGLKLMRKVYYGYLISRRRKMITEEELPDPNHHRAQSNDSSAIETGSLIISLLRQKIHHRLAALKLAVRMITIGGLYPDQFHLTSLLRRMYMSKPEWDSTLEFLAQLPDRSASRWLQTQVAIVEAEDGRVERVLKLSAEALELPPSLQGDFLAPDAINSEIFAHAIQGLIINYETPNSDLASGLRGAIAIRTRMVKSGILPDSESDDLILRRICSVAQGIKSPVSRHEFLSEMIGGMFPTSKIVPIRSEPLRSFRFTSHPGKSPEAFRLMRLLMEFNELDLSLHLFQSISRYGYVSSLTSIPFSYLKRLLGKALHCHPELAMELYQHLHMSGSDRTGELFGAVKAKAIEMGDDRLAEYLLKISDGQDRTPHATRITGFIAGFSRRRASPGNVAKTLSLFNSLWNRWSGASIEPPVWAALSDQILRLGPLKLAQRPELRPQIDLVLRRLEQATLEPTELIKIKKKMIEVVEVSKFIQPDLPIPIDHHSQRPEKESPHHLSTNQQPFKDDNQLLNVIDPSIQTFEDLIALYIRENRLDRAVEASQRAIGKEILVRGPMMGRLLNKLVDKLGRHCQSQDDDADTKDKHHYDHPHQNETTEKEKDDNRIVNGPCSRDTLVDSILLVNQEWRAIAWKAHPILRGSDAEVVRAMERFYRLALSPPQSSCPSSSSSSS
ncbi:hypothetical protein PGT21_020863 [Puccinia graminis f. sp. tritici]|uniref:Uncharacterized protein n=1 Tax=Puccinia graminis f. sp. tritici TaxID=56615 RepID=A0A5B0LPF1_PUCGR|nr:hypothetical protein PGT21_020863 [Puccinia graminis f. sp. tritici]KAA1130274.1 hypothetical protein PGTUg99_002619 [Puccinia graminis f. sp. tritici]